MRAVPECTLNSGSGGGELKILPICARQSSETDVLGTCIGSLSSKKLGQGESSL